MRLSRYMNRGRSRSGRITGYTSSPPPPTTGAIGSTFIIGTSSLA